jgi:hypothetical protein
MSFPVSVPDITVYAGDTFSSPVYVLGTMVNNVFTPYDLVAEGWTNWKAQWRANANDPSFVELTVDTSDATSGAISWTMGADATRSLWNGVWDIQAVQSGTVRTWLRGKTLFVEDVTRV